MKPILHEIWKNDRRGFLRILALNILSSLMASVGIVMLVPMLGLLDIGADADSTLGRLIAPLESIPHLQRSLLLVGIYLLLIVLKALLQRMLSLRETEFIEGYTLSLRNRLYRAVSDAGWERLASYKRTDLINLFTAQCGQVSGGISGVIHMLASAVSALMQLAVALWMSVPLTLLVMAVGGCFLWFFRPLMKKSRAYGEELIAISRAFYSELITQLGSIKEARTYGVQDEHAALFEKVSAAFMDAQMRFTRLRIRPQMFYSIGAAVLIALVFLVSVVFLDMDTARLVVLVYVFARLWPLFSSWQGRMQSILSAAPSLDKLNEALADMARDNAREEKAVAPLPFEKEIELRNVGFTYQGAQEAVLHDVNFTLGRGEIVALVGRSGAGKTTLADLLLGLLKPTVGEMRVDGTPLDEKNLRAWRKLIGYVPQEPLLMNASVRENLARFHPGATEEEMVEALKRSLAWPFVSALPDGLDTLLGDQGVRLSGGERQRVVLARVLMGHPRFMILDEATSALDYESEAMIRDAIHALRGETTVVIIAHRLATIRAADKAVVLEGGTITESGPLQELLQSEDGYLGRMLLVE